MGTAGLVLGTVLILFGFFLISIILLSQAPTQEEWNDSLLSILIISIPMIVIGSLLLRKHDRDKKKEKNS